MNTVLSSSGQLCGCPEILKKSCKFFCRGLDIRVPEIMEAYQLQVILCQDDSKMLADVSWFYPISHLISENIFQIIFVISVTT